MFRFTTIISFSLLSATLASCTHSLDIINRDDYVLPRTEGPRKNVAVLPVDGEDGTTVFAEHVVEGLRRHPSVAQVRTNWRWEKTGDGFRPDIVLKIRPEVNYEGSGWNFLVTFPGFLFFLPAAHGYNYHARLATNIDFYDLKSRDLAQTLVVETDYKMRHCDFERSFFAESGWWTPGWGATSLLSAPFMMAYDDDATQPFQREIGRSYGDYVTEKLSS